MAKYIEESYLLNALGTFNDWKNGNQHFLDGIQTAREVIEDAPEADVAQVVHATWVKANNSEFCITLKCSACQAEHPFWAKKDYQYCPSCGAKMDAKGKPE